MKIKRSFRIILAAVAFLLGASWGFSQALHHGWGRQFLLARLSASFGRPVEAGDFAFSLLRGPSLQADAVSVPEDPRFGQEYFLRADQLRATLDWSALLRGRVEFGTVWFDHPSLNLVRAADGHWNVESWLPPAPSQNSSQADLAAGLRRTPSAAQSPAGRRLSHLVIDDGRINFKLGTEKILFALTDVTGNVDQDGAGHWNLDLEADPMRASIDLQQSGTLRLRGSVAGTSARLRPAALTLTWENASLADALRLASGQDYGVRGVLGAELSARLEDASSTDEKTNGTPNRVAGNNDSSAPGQWRVSGKFHLAGVHRWDLTAHPTDPGINLIFSAAWLPESHQATIEDCLLQTSHSQLEATAEANWSHGFKPVVQVARSRISLEDVLAWTRSFRPNVPDGFSAQGAVELRAALRGWPLQIVETNLSGGGAIVRWPGLAETIHIGPLSASLHQDSLVLAPVAVSLPGAPAPGRARGGNALQVSVPPAGLLRIEASFGPLRDAKSPADWPYRIDLSGHTSRAQDLVAVAQVLGHPITRDWKAEGWKVQGPATLQLAWLGTPRHAMFPPSGSLDLQGVQLTGPLLNQPLLVSSAHIEVRPGERHVKLAAIEALGASWKGTLDWIAADRIWHFDLAADRLDAADLDRWLGPRARPGFFARMLPFVGAFEEDEATHAREAAIGHLMASGQLHVGALALAPVELEKVEASAELRGRNLALRQAQADFFDGRILGDFQAQLTPNPSYSFRGQFDRVNLAELTSSAELPKGRVAGVASGDFDVAAHGIGKESLLASLSAEGNLHVRRAVLRGPALHTLELVSAPLTVGDSRIPGEIRFRTADASFRFAHGLVHVNRLSLAGRDEDLEARGNVGLTRRLDLRVWAVPHGADANADPNPERAAAERMAERVLTPRVSEGSTDRNADRPGWTIGGTLDAPQIAPLVARQTREDGDTAVSAPPTPPSVSPVTSPLTSHR